MWLCRTGVVEVELVVVELVVVELVVVEMLVVNLWHLVSASSSFQHLS